MLLVSAILLLVMLCSSAFAQDNIRVDQKAGQWVAMLQNELYAHPEAFPEPPVSDALAEASAHGDIETLRGILERNPGAVDLRDDIGRTALMLATLPESLEILLEFGADPNAEDEDGYAVLHYHVWSENGAATLPRLLKEPVRPREDGPPLMPGIAVWFVERRNSREGEVILEHLVASGWNINERDPYGNTLLHISAYNDSLPMAMAFVRLGGKPELKNQDGLTALEIASETGARYVAAWLQKQETR